MDCAQILSSKQLAGLRADAMKYNDFKEFSNDYSLHQIHGQYWHITRDPDFTIKRISPRDLSSLSSGTDDVVGLMVTSDIEYWREYFPDRKYVAEIDMSRSFKKKDFHIVNRGFGHEIFIHNLDSVSVKRVITLKSAIAASKRYEKIAPGSEGALKEIFDCIKRRDGMKVEFHDEESGCSDDT